MDIKYNTLVIYILNEDDGSYYNKYEITCLGTTIEYIDTAIKAFINEYAAEYIKFVRIQTDDEPRRFVVNPHDIRDAIWVMAMHCIDLLTEINRMNDYYEWRFNVCSK